MMTSRRLLVMTLVVVGAVVVTVRGREVTAEERLALIRRAQVWTPIDTASLDLRRGPAGPGSFAPGQLITCEYHPEPLGGATPKFSCATEGAELKVKYGGTNGEVYAEVLGSRLLWALGFGADRMYPVRVLCRKCPEWVNGIQRTNGDILVEPAVVERKFSGTDIQIRGTEGWSWPELDIASESTGGAPRAHRDALKLLAAMIQHTDSKTDQQRLLCLDSKCTHPFMLIHDLGKTFGRASATNADATSSVNLMAWVQTPVWKGDSGCVAELPRSLSGTLADPAISEEGRQFLAKRLLLLRDEQLRDLVEVSQVTLRPRDPASGRSGFPTVDEWVAAFKAKRAAIVDRRCGTGAAPTSN